MGIAIRIGATKSSLKGLVDNYTEQGRRAISVTCPASKCLIDKELTETGTRSRSARILIPQAFTYLASAM